MTSAWKYCTLTAKRNVIIQSKVGIVDVFLQRFRIHNYGFDISHYRFLSALGGWVWGVEGGLRRSPMDYPSKGQAVRALLFSLYFPWISFWTNDWVVGDLRRHKTHVTSLHWIPHTVFISHSEIFHCIGLFGTCQNLQFWQICWLNGLSVFLSVSLLFVDLPYHKISKQVSRSSPNMATVSHFTTVPASMLFKK